MSEASPAHVILPDGVTVSALLTAPADARAVTVLAHGAGAGMTHPFLAGFAGGLAERGFATLRYQFPYMERGSGRPDAPATAEATVRAAVAEAKRLLPGLPVFAGGKSFGGRMSSGAEASAPMGIAGLVFLGFPLHPPGRPGIARAEHLSQVGVPMLFLQGTRDEFARLDLLREVVAGLGPRATLHLVEGGDHSFKVPAAAGRKPAAVQAGLLDTFVAWADALMAVG